MENHFKLDAHVHTSETSSCGFLSAAELVKRYHALGYNGIVITDHLHEEYISSLKCKEDWNSCVDHFLYGYKAAKKEGKEIGLEVILGAEIRFGINDNDYLIYGFDENFLRQNPFLHRLTPWEFFEKYGNEILIIHAHPYRNGNETVFVECVHGVEVFNGNPRHNNRNEKALELYNSNPALYSLCGSDTHRDADEGRAYMLFDEHIFNSHLFINNIKRCKYKIGHQ